MGYEEIYNSEWINLKIYRSFLNSGFEYSHELLTIPDCVMIVPFDKELYTTIVRQYRFALDSFSWEVVGGAIEPDDRNPLSAAKRELAEEAGFVADTWINLGYSDLGTETISSKVWFFLAYKLTRFNNEYNYNEISNVKKISLDKALDMIISGKITHLPSVASILIAKSYIENHELFNDRGNF